MDLLEISIVLSLVFGFGFLTYVVALVSTFLRHRPALAGDPGGFDWHLVIPCRDEAVVIADTLGYLRGRFPAAQVWVVDDASQDDTAAIVTGFAERDPLVHLVRRVLPEARTGKGDALNAAYREICAAVPQGADRERIVLCVIDGDGRPSANLLQVCAGPGVFGDPRIGAGQVEVRMSNRDQRHPLPGQGVVANLCAMLLVRLQDVEFRGPISAMQMLRARSATVNLGGNGQVARLAALDAVAEGTGTPWGNALLEDYEIGLRLMLAGRRIAYTTDAWVDQEGLWSLRSLLIQRTRWAQGSMQCLGYLPKVWSSPQFTNAGLLEVTYFMAQPWLQIIGSLAYPAPVIVLLSNAARYPQFTEQFLRDGGAALLGLYFLIGVGEFAVWAWAYRRRCEPGISWRHTAAIGGGLTAYAFLSYVIAWRAFARLVTRRSSWPKTKRNAEMAAVGVPGQGVVEVEGQGVGQGRSQGQGQGQASGEELVRS
ncbi:MAG TPA: glycosyltransferase [Actinocrinis sp.]|nr:glycosyltransferase [Actinocrinis sp.]